MSNFRSVNFSESKDTLPLIDRRLFIKYAVSAGAALSALGVTGCLPSNNLGWQLNQLTHKPDLSRRLSAIQRQTLTAAQDRLLPSSVSGKDINIKHPRSPGAADVNATSYLEGALVYKYINRVDSDLILCGTDKLNQISNQLHQVDYASLEIPVRETLLQQFQDGGKRRNRWIFLVLSLTMEAFFGDPVHGGNPDQIGWKWATIQPPFPRPKNASLFNSII